MTPHRKPYAFPLKHDKNYPNRAFPLRAGVCWKGNSMTVCIAAVVGNAKAIILVADRAIAYLQGGQTKFKTDEGVRKIREIYDGWVGLISGSIDFGEKVLFAAESLYRASQTADSTLHLSMPECVTLAYQESRNALAVDVILKPKLLTQKWYQEKIANPV